MFDLLVSSSRRDYSVSFSSSIPELETGLTDNSFLLIDSKVDFLYPDLSPKFGDRVLVIEATEENKSLPFCQKVISFLVDNGMKRNYKLIAIGGGVIQDITGFVASILFRGVEWVFFPTTLLAQADSCIGSKTSINFMDAKNLVGTFYPPSKIFCCTDFLNTLEDREIKSGIGEILHYYLYNNSLKIDDIVKNYNLLFEDRSRLLSHIAESLSIKQIMVEKDEFDTNERRVFNYGHTFGHAIEIISNYGVPHGQAVTLGMDLANYISFKIGLFDWDKYLSLRKVLKKNMPDFKLTEDKLDLYMSALSKDKKNISDSIVCILAHDIGDIRVHRLNDKQKLKEVILKYIQESA